MNWHTLPAPFLQGTIHVDLAGCGGNGAQLLTGLARLDRALRALGHPGGLHVRAYDPDQVSEANVGRQLFSPSDIGLYKSDVLVTRLNLFYGLAWESLPERYIGARPERWGGPGYGGQTWRASDLLITCVDSAKARRDIYRAITQHRSGARATPHYWLDLGNRQADGQVILGEPGRLARGAAGQAPRLPTVVDVFPELLDESLKEDDRPSCSLAESLETQDLFINDHVSRWALQLLWTLLRRGRIGVHGYFINLAAGEVRGLPVPGPGGPPAAAAAPQYAVRHRRRRPNQRALSVAARRVGR